MEAAVLNRQMMADVNGNNTVMDAELEVKKLQELVRKLERQNEQLRTRANAANHCTSSNHLLSNSICTGNLTTGPGPGQFYTGNYCISSQSTTVPLGSHATDEHCPCFHPQSLSDAENNGCQSSALDEVEILDLRFLLPTDGETEDSWLYVSPKAKLYPHFPLSPLQWCRQVLDKPTPEVELAKRSLCYRLDQAKRWRGVLSSHVSSSINYNPVLGLSSQSTSAKCFTKPALIEQTAPSSPSSHSALQLPLPGRSCNGLAERSPSFLYHTATHNYSRPQAAISPQSSIASEFSMPELDEDSISMNYKLQDMTDVQVMARLQEESLRQEYATTSATCTRRSSSFSVLSGLRRPGRNSVGLEEDEEEDEEDGEQDELPPPQPRLYRAGSMQRSLSHSHGLSSPRDPRRSPSSPHYLSSLSSQQLSPASYLTPAEPQGYRVGTGQHSDKLRKSMPNLIRAPSMLSVPCVPSVAALASHSTFPAHPSSSSSSSLRNSQSFDSPSGLARLQAALPYSGQLQQRVQSVGNFSTASRPLLKATAYVSPTIQGPTTMPSASSISSLSSSGIPVPSKASTTSPASRSTLPRPASFIGTPRSKIAQPARSLLTPPKTVSTLSALRDASWKDGCY